MLVSLDLSSVKAKNIELVCLVVRLSATACFVDEVWNTFGASAMTFNKKSFRG
jgi:hypothetical protein